MAKVKLLKAVGDHREGTELNIADKTVIEAWERLGVIDSDDENSLDKLTVKELHELAISAGHPEEEWKSLKRAELIDYLTVD